MEYFGIIVGLAWTVFAIVWIAGAFTAKRSLSASWQRSSWVRIIIVIILYIFFRQELGRWILGSSKSFTNPDLGAAAAILAVVGIGIAVWARFHIGRNWGMPMSIKENRELVTSGPYSYIRHPIYAGVMLALIGTALLIGPWLLVAFVIYFVYFLFSAKSEEKTLTKEFPDTYPAYKKRTKMLIPFIF